MKKVEILRAERTESATIGVLSVEGKAICWTLEEPWRDNKPDVSCIPEGEYRIEYEWSNKFQRKLWTIKGVPGRTYVRIHKGNTVDDTEGCPLVGNTVGYLDGKRAVLSSASAFDKFVAEMEADEEYLITVRS